MNRLKTIAYFSRTDQTSPRNLTFKQVHNSKINSVKAQYHGTFHFDLNEPSSGGFFPKEKDPRAFPLIYFCKSSINSSKFEITVKGPTLSNAARVKGVSLLTTRAPMPPTSKIQIRKRKEKASKGDKTDLFESDSLD